MAPPAEENMDGAPLKRSPVSPKARRLLVFTGEPGNATDKSRGQTRQLRSAVSAAVNAAKRVQRTAPIR